MMDGMGRTGNLHNLMPLPSLNRDCFLYGTRSMAFDLANPQSTSVHEDTHQNTLNGRERVLHALRLSD